LVTPWTSFLAVADEVKNKKESNRILTYISDGPDVENGYGGEGNYSDDGYE